MALIQRPIIWLATGFEASLALVAWGLGWLLDNKPALAVFDLTWPAAVWGVVTSVPLVLVFVLFLYRPPRALASLKQVVDEIVVPLFRSCRWFELAAICVAAGVGEEMLFRGVLQAKLCDWLGLPLGLASASLLFGLMHPLSGAYILLATVFGLYLGAVWLYTDNLLVPMVAHAVYDFVALIWLLREHSSRSAVRAGVGEGADQV